MIYTVNGPIEKDQMGITLSHEHFKWETDSSYAHKLYFDRDYDDEKTNINFELLIPVLKDLYANSCRTIVETSPPIGGQNIKLLRKLSLESGVNIIPCTGWNLSKYTQRIHSNNFAKELAFQWIKDFQEGLDTIDGINIKPGYIKLLLDRGDFSTVDQEMVRAAVMASKETAMPIHCHILEAEMLYSVIDLLEEENLDLSKFLWAHASKEGDFDAINYGVDKGIWIGFDMIREGTYEKNFELISKAIKLGFEDKVLLSQDYDFYEQAVEHNNPQSCVSFFTKFIPYCYNYGMSENIIDKMITENPANFYDF